MGGQTQWPRWVHSRRRRENWSARGAAGCAGDLGWLEQTREAPRPRGRWGVFYMGGRCMDATHADLRFQMAGEDEMQRIGWELSLQGGVRWSRNDPGACLDLHGPMGSEDQVFWMQMGKPILSY